VIKRITLATFLIIIAFLPGISQEISVDVTDKPLNEILIDLSATYELQISFNDKELARYRVTQKGTYSSPEEVITKLLKGLPLDWERTGEVFVIFPAAQKEKPPRYTVMGCVMDKTSREPLPYSHVTVDGQGTVTDLKGYFSLPASDSSSAIRVSHLGYYILDTLVIHTSSLEILLMPSMIGLSEIEIRDAVVSREALAGREAGTMKLNHQVAGFLPGFGDNSVFNLLRLQPGILASGEQTNELIIWGCYEGQSKIMFDGFTVYSLKNFNDNISVFNPLMVKDIEVYKGGYGARYGDRVGGIVNITGKNGNMVKPSFTFNINNMTLNGMVEIPVVKNNSLVVAFRSTYYELFNPTDINTRLWRNNDRDTTNDADYNIIPDYRFNDINIKYSSLIHGRDLFYISLYGGNDRFYYSLDEPLKHVIVTKDTEETNTQLGGSAYYGKNWMNGSSTSLSMNYSGLKSGYTDELTIEGNSQQFGKRIRDESSLNTIREYTVQADHHFIAGRNHSFEGGLDLKVNAIELQEDTFNISQVHMEDVAQRLGLYFQDEISLGNKLNLKAGLRLSQSFNLKELFPEPRLSLSYRATQSWRLNAAWGLYNQFIALSSVVDDLGNFRYIWTVCDNEDVPVLRAMHLVAGVSYDHNDFTISLESYYRTTTGLTRFVRNNYYQEEGIFEGNGRSYGLDIMLKKDYRGHSAWISYSLSRTEELFEYFLNSEYQRAPQDQPHELKFALLLNFDPIYFSADYIYGSGFPNPAYLTLQKEEDLRYSRLDAALIYKFLDRKLKGEIGLSVLNVMNTENIKYENFERIPVSQKNSITLYAEAIPITPALYLKLSL
jgi:hypothetical protein